MAPSDHPDLPALVRDLLAYFVRRRDARATLEDLARWRIEQERTSHTLDQVHEALMWLERAPNELIVRWPDDPGSPDPPVFRLNPMKAAEAERLLARLSDARRAADAPRPAGPPAPGPAASAPLMSRGLAWVDAALRRYNRANPLGKPDDHAGAARDPEVLDAILSPVVTPEASGGEVASAADDSRALIDAFEAADGGEPLAALYRSLELTPLELQVVLLSLASEVDAKYHLAFGIRNDDLGRRSVTLGLACAMLGNALDVRRELEHTGALSRWRLLDNGGVFPHAEDTLRLDPFVIAWLFGHADALRQDPRLTPFVRLEPWPGADWLDDTSDAALVTHLRGRLAQHAERWTALAGGDRNGARAAVESAARLDGAPLLRIVLPSPAPTDVNDVDDVVIRLARAARLEQAIAVVDAGSADADALGPGGLARLFEALSAGLGHLVIVAADLERVMPALPRTPGERLVAELPADLALAPVYRAAAAAQRLEIDAAAAERLAATFPLPLASIESAVRLAAMTVKGTARSAEADATALFDACRRVASPSLPRFGRRVEPVFSLDDVVLPREQRAQMDEIVSHVRYAPHVMHRWGFSERLPYGRGVAALFAGPSGTGKTMAAQAIARELGTEAYIVDLSRVVSKYIGETEKNLDAVFEDAERAGAVLVFDEADALFGKRSEIKDAHDRYANIEVAYLLQRIEIFGVRGGLGLAILTSNFKQNLDPALVRRLRFIVEFRKPDEHAREEIWRRSLATRVPLAGNLNLRFLAKRLDLSGGNIQQIAVRAAFAAASERAESIDMQHVMGAARAELLKLGLAAAERELGKFETAFRRDAEVA